MRPQKAEPIVGAGGAWHRSGGTKILRNMRSHEPESGTSFHPLAYQFPFPSSGLSVPSSQIPNSSQLLWLPVPNYHFPSLAACRTREYPGVGGIQKFKKVVLGAGGWGQCGGGKIPKLDLIIPNFVGAGIDYP